MTLDDIRAKLPGGARGDKNSNPTGLGRRVLRGLIAVIGLVLLTKMLVVANNHEVIAITYPNGHVAFLTESGPACQCLGSIETFDKLTPYAFEEGIQFNDGAHATLKGSVNVEMPLDVEHLTAMYQRFKSPEAIETSLIQTNIQKAVYLTGQMMSSTESYAEKRADLLRYVEDQAQNGVYQTRRVTVDVTDPLDTSKTKSITQVQVVLGPNGLPAREETGVLSRYGITTSNFNFTIEYKKEVEDQIQAQQKLAQDINTSIAQAKKAEQRTITVEKDGQADAAAAKWEQEKINATQEAQNEQIVKNAKLNRERAEADKQANILEGEGLAEKQRLIMQANGALETKLNAWLKAQEMWSSAFKGYAGAVVPQIVSGGGAGAQNGALTFMDLMTAKTAKDLALDMSVQGSKK